MGGWEGGGAQQPMGGMVNFSVMIKKGAKAAVRDIQVPRTAGIAQVNKTREAAALQEKSEIKRLVLESESREQNASVFQLRRRTERW